MEVEQFEIPLQDNFFIEVINESQGGGCSEPILNKLWRSSMMRKDEIRLVFYGRCCYQGMRHSGFQV